MEYKTTKKDFEKFKKEARKWIKFFGLIDWEIYFEHKESAEEDYAWCISDPVNRCVTVGFGKKFNQKPDKYEIEICAFHEIVEIILSPLRGMANARFVTVDEINSANHYIVRILENTLFGKKVGN